MDFDRNPVAIERLLTFGRDLQALYSRLTSTHPNEQLKATLQVSSRGLAGLALAPRSLHPHTGLLQPAGVHRPKDQPGGLPPRPHPEGARLCCPQLRHSRWDPQPLLLCVIVQGSTLAFLLSFPSLQESAWSATVGVCTGPGCPESQAHVSEWTGSSSLHWSSGHCQLIARSHYSL